MPVVDNDKMVFNKSTREGAIEVQFKWVDGVTGEDKGTYGMSWSGLDELKEWLSAQSFEDLARAVMLNCINRETGALRNQYFDALAGKTMQVTAKVTQV